MLTSLSTAEYPGDHDDASTSRGLWILQSAGEGADRPARRRGALAQLSHLAEKRQ